MFFFVTDGQKRDYLSRLKMYFLVTDAVPLGPTLVPAFKLHGVILIFSIYLLRFAYEVPPLHGLTFGARFPHIFQAWWKVMAAYCRVDGLKSDYIHRDQLRWTAMLFGWIDFEVFCCTEVTRCITGIEI